MTAKAGRMFREKQNLKRYFTGPIEVRPSRLHGNVVFATEEIKANMCIEICPTILFNVNILREFAREFGTLHPLQNYVFGEHESGLVSLALGYGSLYNHHMQEYNTVWRWSKEMKEPSIEFWSSRDVKKDQELLIRYTKDEEIERWYTL